MTPDQARELLIQAKCEQNTHKGYRDALHTLSGLRCEHRVIHPTPGVMTPTPLLHSEAEAEKVITSTRHIFGNATADQLIIQRRLIGEWEDIS